MNCEKPTFQKVFRQLCTSACKTNLYKKVCECITSVSSSNHVGKASHDLWFGVVSFF